MPDARRPGRMHAVLALAVVLIAACGAPQKEGQLPKLGADGALTVSGISSGGYMAGQYLVAHSSRVAGAAIVAAGPWGCALGSMQAALSVCISGDGIDNDALHERAEALATSDRIDALSHLGDARLMLFRGSRDAVIGAAAMQRARSWFGRYVDAAGIVEVDDVPAAHGWPTKEFGAVCDSFEAPFINRCDYDLAGELLSHLYPGLASPPSEAEGDLEVFEQKPFGDANLADTGYVYVPAACRAEDGCGVHVFFHGCDQSAASIGTTLADNAGFNAWAEANRIVVLYPQVEPSRLAPLNPLGCWDWWGYGGDNYLARTAPQISAVDAMVKTLAAER